VSFYSTVRNFKRVCLSSDEGKGMKYLVVDDNEQFRKSIEELLLKPGDEYRELDDGAEVNTVYEEFHPDMVLLDIKMKQMNGFEAGELLKHRFPEAHFIIVSNFDDERFRQKARMIGADALVAKENLEVLTEICKAHEIGK
jgi:CheY-like chemotaxis protein